MERWKAINGYEGIYEVSNKGDVRNIATGKLLKRRSNGNGYVRIELWKNHKGKKYYMHRLVAEAFIPNPDGKTEVNHKDLDTSNNAVENLEWVSSSENTIHAIDNKALKAWGNEAMPIIARRLDSGCTIQFRSISEAERVLGTRHITDVLKGKRRQAKGYTFAYKEGGDAECPH